MHDELLTVKDLHKQTKLSLNAVRRAINKAKINGQAVLRYRLPCMGYPAKEALEACNAAKLDHVPDGYALLADYFQPEDETRYNCLYHLAHATKTGKTVRLNGHVPKRAYPVTVLDKAKAKTLARYPTTEAKPHGPGPRPSATKSSVEERMGDMEVRLNTNTKLAFQDAEKRTKKHLDAMEASLMTHLNAIMAMLEPFDVKRPDPTDAPTNGKAHAQD